MKKRSEKKDIVEKEVDDAVKKVEEQLEVAKQEIKKEIILNVPNSITFSRLILTFLFIYMLFQNYSKIALFVVFTVAAITDWFDGYFARKLNQKTKFGARLDQVVDRIFTLMIVGSIIIFLISRQNSFDNIFRLSRDNVFLLLFLTTSREIVGFPGVIIALFRKKTTYSVRYIGKVTTFVQSVTLAAIILGVPFAIYLALVTCIIGIISGLDYLRYSLN